MLGYLGFAGSFIRHVVQVTSWTPEGILDLDELLGVSLAAGADEDLARLILAPTDPAPVTDGACCCGRGHCDILAPQP